MRDVGFSCSLERISHGFWFLDLGFLGLNEVKSALFFSKGFF